MAKKEKEKEKLFSNMNNATAYYSRKGFRIEYRNRFIIEMLSHDGMNKVVLEKVGIESVMGTES